MSSEFPKTNKKLLIALLAASAVLMSLPWLVPGAGLLALFGLVPLLCAERLSGGVKRFWLWYYLFFVVWNALTTFWVWNATAGGAIFAIMANAAQMAVIFALFRLARRRLGGTVPYIFLMVAWIAWERFYFSAEISWPWLVLGNAFARTTLFAQWYDVTGVLGGSLWIWATNLSLFGVMVALSEGRVALWNVKARIAASTGLLALLLVPAAISVAKYSSFDEKSEGAKQVLIAQPNYDPYQKFESLSQAEQTAGLLELMSHADSSVDLLIAPETFTGDIWLNDVRTSRTWQSFERFLSERPGMQLLFGASTHLFYERRSRPTPLAREYSGGWLSSYNSAFVMDAASHEMCHKGKLVAGVEKTPYPALFVPIDDMLGGVMGRCEEPEEPSVLHCDGVPFGCAICYESIYPEHCATYVRKGAKFLAVITNDAWWGDTPGYRQHLSYASLRAIETRRDIARCGNTGISAFINQRGDILQSSEWWQRTILRGAVNLNSETTFFVRYGDITGRVCTLAFLLLLLLLLSRLFIRK